MAWSWTIGWIAGIRVRMHWSFPLLLIWVGASAAAQGESQAAILSGIGFILTLFGCVVLHEAGHAVTARRYGVVTESITLLPIGGVASMQRIPSEPWHEFWIAVAGPAVNVVIAGVLYLTIRLSGLHGAITAFPVSPGSFLVSLMAVNIALVLFNLLPAFPMDGGRVLRALLATRMDYVQATNIAATIGQAMAILFGIMGLFSQPINPFLLFIAIFVYVGAEGEAQAVRFRSLLGGTTVGDAMITQFRSLRPDSTLQDAVNQLLAGSQQDFPVVDETGVKGLLRRSALVEALRQHGTEESVTVAMAPLPERLSSSAPLHDVVEHMRQSGTQALPVFEDHKLAGMLTMENVAELILVRAAKAAHDGTGR